MPSHSVTPTHLPTHPYHPCTHLPLCQRRLVAEFQETHGQVVERGLEDELGLDQPMNFKQVGC